MSVWVEMGLDIERREVCVKFPYLIWFWCIPVREQFFTVRVRSALLGVAKNLAAKLNQIQIKSDGHRVTYS